MKVKTLGELCNIVSGGTPSRSKAEFWNDGTVPWIKIGNIKESVKQVLSELDWKTYANAAEKAKERWSNTFDDKKSRQKYGDMWDKFDKASEKTFNDEYGTSKYHYTTDGINNIHHNWDRMMCRPTKHRKVATLSDNGWNESYFDFDPVSNETDGRYWFNNHDFLSGKGDEDEIFDSLGKKVGSEHFNAAKNGNKERI